MLVKYKFKNGNGVLGSIGTLKTMLVKYKWEYMSHLPLQFSLFKNNAC